MPRSTSRRASRQFAANDDSPGFTPYLASVSGFSFDTSIISGALVMGDSLDFSAREVVIHAFGLVDEIVWLPNASAPPAYTGSVAFAVQPKEFFPEFPR